MNNVSITINGKDARSTWGVWIEDGSLSALMTPVPKKKYISNKSPLEAGRQVLTDAKFIPKNDERDVALFFALRATSDADFLAKYNGFCQELAKGAITLSVAFSGGSITYNLIYQSCQQYREYDGRLAKFRIKFNEPNPDNRK